MNNLEKAIEAVSAEQGKTKLDIISEMQAGCVITKDDATLEKLCAIKSKIIDAMFA